jgi:hypothetical protein
MRRLPPATVADDGFSRNQLQRPLRVMVAGGFLAYIAPFISFGGAAERRRAALAAQLAFTPYTRHTIIL